MKSILKLNSKLLQLLLLFLEAGIGFLSYQATGALITGKFVPFSPFLVLFLSFWFFFAYKNGLYTSFRTKTLLDETVAIFKAVAYAAAFTSLLAFVMPNVQSLVARNVISCTVIFACSLTLFRLLIRHLLRFFRRRGFNYREILLVGTNDRAVSIINEVSSNPSYGIRIIGVIDDLSRSSYWSSVSAAPFLGDIVDLKRTLVNYVVDGIIITLPVGTFYREISEIIGICEEIGLPAHVRDPFRKKTVDAPSFSMAGLHFFSYVGVRTGGWRFMVKRLIDVSFSLLFLVALAPALLLISVLIKVTSAGPALFKQVRVGKNSRLFELYKLRTMVKDAEKLKEDLLDRNEMDGPAFKIKNDPRITRIGRGLRKFSIDEIPQLINVLNGDMSLVGPRPGLKEEVEVYIWNHRKRLSVIPGITGLWQIMGRNEISFDEWMKLDIYYVENWSLKLDLYILLKTIPVVLSAKGAS